MYSEREIVAYHEAGHVCAAVRRGGTVDGIDISFAANRTRGWNAIAVPASDDLAFYAYAGSWVDDVLLRPAGEPIDIDELWFRVQGNNTDWGELQRALRGHAVSDDDIWGIQVYADERLPPPAGFEVRPPIATVLQWHGDLDDEWPRIKALARQLLDGPPEIRIGTGVPLERVSESRWLRPGYTPDETLNQF
jgi:hypothetical protein